MLDQAALSQHAFMHCASVPTVLTTRSPESVKSLELCTVAQEFSCNPQVANDESTMNLALMHMRFARSPQVDLVVSVFMHVAAYGTASRLHTVVTSIS
jgi:hypothetical protein